jgi:cell shape-determining protein MreC
MQQRGLAQHRPWAAVLLCLGLVALPAQWRRQVRARLLTVHARLADLSGLDRRGQRERDVDAGVTARERLLESQLLQLRSALADAGAAREVFDLEPDAELIPARAYPLGRGVDLTHRIILDRGRQDGVVSGLPVLAGRALVGRVAQVTETTCEVRLINDPTFRVRASIHRADGEPIEGLLKGDGSESLIFEPAMLDPAAPLPSLRLGDTLLCSRASVLCGLPAVIGVVRGEERLPGSPFPRARVEPGCDLTALEQVVIVRLALQEPTYP